MDVSQFRQAWGDNATFVLRAPWSSEGWHCAALDGLTAEDTNALQTEPQTVGENAPFESASLLGLDWLGQDLAGTIRADGTAMFAFEATRRQWTYDGPEVVVKLGDAEIFSCQLPTSVTSVDEMYRYVNLRGAETNQQFTASISGDPTNLPDNETDNRNFVFVHGYNVNAEASHFSNRFRACERTFPSFPW